MSQMRWERAKYRKGRSLKDEAERLHKDAAARWLEQHEKQATLQTKAKPRSQRRQARANRSSDFRQTIGTNYREVEHDRPPWE